MIFHYYGLPFDPSGFKDGQQIAECLIVCNNMLNRIQFLEGWLANMREEMTGRFEVCELWHEPKCELWPLSVYVGRSLEYVQGRGRVCPCNRLKFKVIQFDDFAEYNRGLAQHNVDLSGYLTHVKLRNNSRLGGIQ